MHQGKIHIYRPGKYQVHANTYHSQTHYHDYDSISRLWFRKDTQSHQLNGLGCLPKLAGSVILLKWKGDNHLKTVQPNFQKWSSQGFRAQDSQGKVEPSSKGARAGFQSEDQNTLNYHIITHADPRKCMRRLGLKQILTLK